MNRQRSNVASARPAVLLPAAMKPVNATTCTLFWLCDTQWLSEAAIVASRGADPHFSLYGGGGRTMLPTGDDAVRSADYSSVHATHSDRRSPAEDSPGDDSGDGGSAVCRDSEAEAVIPATRRKTVPASTLRLIQGPPLGRYLSAL